MSEVRSNYAKTQVLKALLDLHNSDLEAMHLWFSSNDYQRDLKIMKATRGAQQFINNIRKKLKAITPFEAEYPTENINVPKVGDQADCTKENTCHIDEFLYDEEDINKLEQEEKIKRHYCIDCNSRNIKELTFISHSMSQTAIQYVFKVLLPEDLDGKCVLDVGSRLGAIMFGGYFFSNASSILGIEISKEWCDLLNQFIKEYNLDNKRMQVFCADAMNCAELIQKSNIIFINVLDFFVDEQKHKEMWRFFKTNITKGSYVVCNRSADETFGYLGLNEELSEWLRICRPFHPENEIYFDFDEFNYGDLYLYCVA